MKIILLLLPLILLFNINQVLGENNVDLELQGFKEAFQNVHYVAKINITKIEVIKGTDDGFNKFIYSADVLSTYLGKVHKQVSYEMFIEKGEEEIFTSSPVYIALCINDQGVYYWPGTGSQFVASDAINSWLTVNQNTVGDISSTANWCR